MVVPIQESRCQHTTYKLCRELGAKTTKTVQRSSTLTIDAI